MPRTLLAQALALAIVAPAALSAAQPEADVRVAARAFEEGQRAQLEGDYVRAANLFEMAHRAAPAAAALRAAIRNYRAAGSLARAATLSLEAISRYATDAPTRSLAQEVLSESEGRLGRVRVSCASPCGVTVDGALVSLRSVETMEVFVEPGARAVQADFDAGGQATAEVEVAAGEVQAVSLEPPPEEAAAPADAGDDEASGAASDLGAGREASGDHAAGETEPPRGAFRHEPRRLQRPPRRGWPPAVTYVGIGVTAGLGAVLVWSVANLLDTSETYEANPTRELYERGQDKIRRTWLLGAATAAAALGTVLIAVLATDWYGDDDEAARAWSPTLSLSSEGAGLGLVGRFRGLR